MFCKPHEAPKFQARVHVEYKQKQRQNISQITDFMKKALHRISYLTYVLSLFLFIFQNFGKILGFGAHTSTHVSIGVNFGARQILPQSVQRGAPAERKTF